jgi:hypothetical protein
MTPGKVGGRNRQQSAEQKSECVPVLNARSAVIDAVGAHFVPYWLET